MRVINSKTFAEAYLGIGAKVVVSEWFVSTCRDPLRETLEQVTSPRGNMIERHYSHIHEEIVALLQAARTAAARSVNALHDSDLLGNRTAHRGI